MRGKEIIWHAGAAAALEALVPARGLLRVGAARGVARRISSFGMHCSGKTVHPEQLKSLLDNREVRNFLKASAKDSVSFGITGVSGGPVNQETKDPSLKLQVEEALEEDGHVYDHHQR